MRDNYYTTLGHMGLDYAQGANMPTSLLDELLQDFQTAQSASQGKPCLGSLATSEANGQARVRTVLLHDVSRDGILMIVSSYHQKWIQLAHDSRAEILIWWPDLGLQYRVSGRCETLPSDVATERWLKLPEGARQLDSAYGPDFLPGQTIESYQAMRDAVSDRSRGKTLSRTPDHVKAIRLTYQEIERLKVSPADRMHDRRFAKVVDGEWTNLQLIP